MSELDQLPPEQRAVLSLLLRQGKGYDDVAALLRIDPDAVRARALAAMTALGPPELSELAPEIRAEVGDYLLRQQTADESEATRALFRSSGGARSWAQTVSERVSELAAEPLPPVPPSPPGPANQPRPMLIPPPPPSPPSRGPAPAAPGEGQPPAPIQPPRRPAAGVEREPEAEDKVAARSRIGGYLVLGALAVIIAVVVIIALNGGFGSGGSGGNGVVSASTSTPASSTTSTSTAQPKIVAQINFSPPNGSSHALAVANIIVQGNLKAFALSAQGLAPTNGFAYAVWLYNSQTNAKLLGFINQQVTSNGQAKAIAALPADASHYREMVITRETAPKPAQPGPVVLVGQLGSAA